MKFWHKLFIMFAVIAAVLISGIVYVEYHAAHETAREIDAISREVLSGQAQTYLAKIISDQASKTALKIDQAKKATLYAATAISGIPEELDNNLQVTSLLNQIKATAGRYFQQIFHHRSDGERIYGVSTDTSQAGGSYNPILMPDRGKNLITDSGADLWHEIPAGYPLRKLDVYALTYTPVGAGEQPSSHLGAIISISDLISEFNQDQPVKGSYTFLINQDGYLLAAPPNARNDLVPIPSYTSHGFINLMATNTEPHLKKALTNAALGRSAVEQVIIRNQPKFLAYRPIDGSNWRLCLISPVTLATAGASKVSNFITTSSRQRINNLVTTSLFFLLATIGLVAFLSRQLTHPLMKMEHATQRIADGDLEQIVPAKSTDEIGMLARSFNSMTKALKESMQQLSASKEDIANQLQMTTTLLETIPTPVYYKNSEGQISGCNSAFEKFFGIVRSEIIGTTRHLPLPPNMAYDDHRQDRELIRKSGSHRYEMQVPDNEGRERHVIINKAAIKGGDAERLGMIGVLTDITDRIRAEKSLRQYERIVSATSDLMSFIDHNYTYLAVNDAYLKAHKKRKEDIVGRTIPDLMGLFVFEEKIKGSIDQCLSGRIVNYQAWFEFAGAGRRYMDVTYYPYHESDSTVTGIVVNSRDITHTFQLESQLRQASKMESIGTLAGGIAHDFNNILSPIIGFSELLLNEISNQQPFSGYAEKILTAAMRARDLVKQILIFSRQADQEIKAIRIDLLLKEALNLARSSLPSTIDIQLEVSSQNRTILADPTEIHQLIMNLITNAFHAMEETGGSLFIGLEDQYITVEELKDVSMEPGIYLCLTVKDTGHGMDSDTLEKIFDPYFTTKDVNKGTGLGLAVAHGVAKSYGGTITVESVIDMGTEFRVYLPSNAMEEETVTPIPDIDVKGGNEHILVIDDEVMVAGLITTILEHIGYRITQCTNSEEAYQIFEKDPDTFDLVITDLTMPHMTGIELINRIRQISKDTKIILSSGFSEQIDQMKAQHMGIAAMILKPIVRTDLATVVRQVLDKD